MENTVLQARLAAAYNYFKKLGHTHNVSRISELAIKLKTGEYGIAFAGHFSAGKSRMINNILGENLLPSSPIPTSANLVRVQKGENSQEYARVFFHKGRPRKYLAPYDYDLIRGFCKDGDRITEIQLCRRDLSLPEQVVVMDTPGIDSADDAHRQSTEAALHLADIILYVMDYNHVQSELNLSFTRELTQAGKTVFLVVNQIDKHIETELSFDSFRQGVENAFLGWGVKPAGFFYTSLKNPEFPYNQFKELQRLLQDKIAHRQELLAESIQASLNKVFAEYAQEQEAAAKEKASESLKILENIPEDTQERLRGDYKRLVAEKADMQQDWEGQLDEQIKSILDNAYLMPTSTRDLARDYLEACQPDFKVGFFGRGKKTMAELERRKNAFFEDASEKAKTQLAWHVKTCLTDFARKYHIDSQDLTDFVQKMEILPPEELLTEAMRSGAKLTQDGTYVMNYTANFAEGTKKVALRYVLEYKNQIENLLNQRNKQRLQEIEEQLSSMVDYINVWKLLNLQEEKAQKLAEDAAGILQETKLPFHWQEAFASPAMDEEIVAPDGQVAVSQPSNEVSVEKAAETPETKSIHEHNENTGTAVRQQENDMEGQDKATGRGALVYWAGKLHEGSRLISQIPVLEQLSSELEARAQRLENKGFLVTLFGAFSAGKSSFANSLLGENLLPVSPNPTTAAINKICPVDEAHPHGTVIVKLKDAHMLLEDINRALGAFELYAANMAEALALSDKALADNANTKQREKAFLRAFMSGYDEAAINLGQELVCNLSDFAAYAAQEEKSCFVDWLEVYYDCPFTRLGITLVDTPGADSINARHTNTSFNYIRQSDVVLFVTYYNHAFSKADREFLIQMGRVKDAFALDKMFFIVNAIDLAEDKDEAQGVISYVANQLQKYGVRNPRMFGLSSKEILQEKLAGRTTGFEFEDAFYDFVFRELTNIAINAAAGEYALAQERLAELIKLSQGSVEEKRQRGDLLEQQHAQAKKLIDNLSIAEMQNRQQQEVQELIYYVRQRVFLRYTDFYRESFNPATIKREGKADKMLSHALGELLGSMGFDFAQELRATGLRMENFIKQLSDKLQQQVNDKLLEISSELPVARGNIECSSKLEYESAFQNVDKGIFKKAFAIYKNPKSFFEQGGSKEMADAIEKLLEPLADSYLAQQKERLEQEMAAAADTAFVQVQKHFRSHLREKLAANLAALEGDVPVQVLQNIQVKLI